MADLSLLRADRATQLGVRVLGETMRSIQKAFPAGSVADFQADDIHLHDVRFGLYQNSDVGGAVPSEAANAADGLIGLDLLRRQGAVINCRTRQLFFRQPGARRLDLAQGTRALGFLKVLIIPYRHDFVGVPCHLSGRLGQLALDTGAFVTLLADDVVREFKIPDRPVATHHARARWRGAHDRAGASARYAHRQHPRSHRRPLP